MEHKNNEKLLSIIVPIYNVEHYLDRCVDSILSQTYTTIEVLLIDDGSPDNCPNLCDKWAERDSRIKVFHKKNGGASDARNYGLDCAKGDYVTFVDGDDYIKKDMYKTMIDAMVNTGSSLSCCGRIYKKQESETLSRTRNSQVVFSDSEAIRELLNNGCVEEAVWDKVYKSSLWEGIRFPVGETNEDIVVIPKIIQRAKSIVHVGEPFYYYCYNEESVTKSGYSNKKDVVFKHLEDLTTFINIYYPEEVKYLGVIKGRYAQMTLYAIVLSDEIDKFNDSYYKYKCLLKESFWSILNTENFSKKKKIEAFLLLLGVYKKIWAIVHWLKE